MTPVPKPGPAGIRDTTGKIVLAFDDNDPAFVRGFEAGQVWGLMSARNMVAFQCYIRDHNIEMAWRMAYVRHFHVATAREDEDGYILVQFLRHGYEWDEKGEPRPVAS